MDHHDIEFTANARDRRDVADEVEIQLVVERLVDCGRGTERKQRIAIRRCTHDGLGADIAACARSVLDEEWLSESLRQPLGDQTREDVICPAGRNWDDDANWPSRIGLRPS